MAVEARGRQQPQLGEHGWRHLLGLVDDQHRSRQSGVDVGLPAITQHLGPGPAVVRSQPAAEQTAHLAIEVGEAGLRARDDADPDVALRAEALGENAQRDRLAGAGGAGDEGEAAGLIEDFGLHLICKYLAQSYARKAWPFRPPPLAASGLTGVAPSEACSTMRCIGGLSLNVGF